MTRTYIYIIYKYTCKHVLLQNHLRGAVLGCLAVAIQVGASHDEAKDL